MSNRYASLDDVLQENEAGNPKPETLQFIMQALETISARIDEATADEFWPRIGTRYFSARGDHILSSTVMDVVAGQSTKVRSGLLSITSVTLGGDEAALGADTYQADPLGTTPIRRVQLTDSGSWLSYGTTPRSAHAITGIWGNRSSYATEGWRLSGDTLRTAVGSANATELAVNDPVGRPTRWSPVRFQAGQLIRVGTGTAWYRVEDVNEDTRMLAVTPNVNGSTSTAHDINTPIYIFDVEPTIRRAALKWAGLLLSRKGQFNTQSYNVETTVVTRFPTDMPDEVNNILKDGGYIANKFRWRTP